MRTVKATLMASVRSRRRGLGLPEMLISLVIAASLLTATAVAIDASSKAYQVNEEQSSLIQRTRLTLNRVTTTIRTNKLHQPHSPSMVSSFGAGNTVIDTRIDMYDGQGNLLADAVGAPNQRSPMSLHGSPPVRAERGP